MKGNGNHIWVGFGTLEQLLAAMPEGATIFLNGTIRQEGSGKTPIIYETHELRAMVLVPDAVTGAIAIYYWQVRTGMAQTFQGHKDWDKDYQKVNAGAQRAQELTRAYLEALGRKVVEATVAAPNNLTLMYGGVDHMSYNKEEKSWEPVMQEAA